MFHKLALVIQPEYIYAGPIMIVWSLLVTMQNHVIALGNHPFELDVSRDGVFVLYHISKQLPGRYAEKI
jgi:hypothetical protein